LENKNYTIRVAAFTVAGTSRESDEVTYLVPQRDQERAIIAGVVGGLLFFIVAIILSVCAVKICNRRKRRKQEKGKPVSDCSSGVAAGANVTNFLICLAYNMVACRLTDGRNGGQIPTQPQIPVKR